MKLENLNLVELNASELTSFEGGGFGKVIWDAIRGGLIWDAIKYGYNNPIEMPDWQKQKMGGL
ncbi:MAG TPA: hypothetical protein PKD85_02725 [Saprospiraceae bacterium]|nr:hypothetical protein [Saprospiraceae bacterium]